MWQISKSHLVQCWLKAKPALKRFLRALSKFSWDEDFITSPAWCVKASRSKLKCCFPTDSGMVFEMRMDVKRKEYETSFALLVLRKLQRKSKCPVLSSYPKSKHLTFLWYVCCHGFCRFYKKQSFKEELKDKHWFSMTDVLNLNPWAVRCLFLSYSQWLKFW